MSSLLKRYMAMVSGMSFSIGVQLVLLPWLAVGALGAGAEQLGWVQAAVLFPSLLLMLLGGVLADRFPNTSYLAGLFTALAATHIALIFIVQNSTLSLSSLILYGVVVGSLNAFIQPLRERLLTSVSQVSMQRSVTWVNFFQYAFQAMGVLMSGQIDRFGLAPIVLSQVAALSLAILMCAFLGRIKGQKRTLSPWHDGLRAVWANPICRSLTILVTFNGFMHIGVFIVVLPLLVRDVYGVSADFYSWLQLSFVAGTLSSTIVLLKRAEVMRPGRALLLCLFYAAFLMFAISAGPKLSGLFLLVYLWGVLTGISASLGRGLMQQQAAESMRGRVLSIYQLALFGSAPLGALFAGFAAERWGLEVVLEIAAASSVGLFILSYFYPKLWQLDNTNR